MDLGLRVHSLPEMPELGPAVANRRVVFAA